ncbi:universal stress protein [Lichenibacterium dinghuense]|uniref:universal stress protein n=1 Tax=Lichenibacterium dinghuense TaxID=2895977 RepID=UPI001F36E0B5|nr:universal stress protein [Lichenibacterium sp. 6Y81]
MTEYKDILVFLDVGEDCAARTDVAVHLAARHGARLVGVDVGTPAASEGHWRDRALGLREAFETKARSANVATTFRVAAPEARVAHDFGAHCADLIVATQPHPDAEHLSAKAVPRDVLVGAGVPMLLLPTGWRSRETLGRRLLIAWNFSREATRAVHDAMPLLAAAEKVFLFLFEQDFDRRRLDVTDVKEHLERHGAKVEVSGWQDTGEVEVASAMFAGLDRDEVDLIVAGAYGRSPLAETMFGGTTETLLNNVSMPVLLSH